MSTVLEPEPPLELEVELELELLLEPHAATTSAATTAEQVTSPVRNLILLLS
jgi:hypothetical protein